MVQSKLLSRTSLPKNEQLGEYNKWICVWWIWKGGTSGIGRKFNFLHTRTNFFPPAATVYYLDQISTHEEIDTQNEIPPQTKTPASAPTIIPTREAAFANWAI